MIIVKYTNSIKIALDNILKNIKNFKNNNNLYYLYKNHVF